MTFNSAVPRDPDPRLAREEGAPEPVIIADRYEIEAIVGSGGMARVYRARDRVLQRPVAVKVLRDEYCADPDFVARFSREARAAASLQHPNIVDVYDYGRHGDRYYIVMQYVEGPDLKAILKRQGVLPIRVSIAILSQVLRALAAAHERGIVHRDVKPHNILVHGDNQVKLTDFGIARLSHTAGVTASATTLGTASYMAPEQANGGPIGPAVDIYASGVVFFEMLTGGLPFQGDSPLQVMMKHLHEPPPRAPNLSPAIDHVVRRALAKDPAHRFPSAGSMLSALTAAGARYTKSAGTRTDATDAAGVTRAIAIRPSVHARAARRDRAAVWPAAITVAILLALLAGAWRVWSTFLLVPGSMQPPAATVTRVAAPATAVVAQGPQLVETNTPTASPTATFPAPAAVAPPLAPSATRTPVPTLTPRPTATIAPTPTPRAPVVIAPTSTPRPTPLAAPTATPTPRPVAAPATIRLGAETLGGAYRRTDGTLYGRPESAIYGSGSPYSEASTTFQWRGGGANAPIALLLTGLDDERVQQCDWEIVLNGVVIYRGPTRFPNVPSNDNGVGGPDRYWGRDRIQLPGEALRNGANTLTFRNLTPWQGFLGIPYILINEVTVGQ